MSNMDHMAHLAAVSARDVEELERKEATYQGSWKAEGGRSAWMNVKRKIDRLLVMMARPPEPPTFNLQNVDDTISAVVRGDADVHGAVRCRFPGTQPATVGMLRHLRACYAADDILAGIGAGPGGEDGTVLAEVRDLRRYLLLVEAEATARGLLGAPRLVPREAPKRGPVGQAAVAARPEDGWPPSDPAPWWPTVTVPGIVPWHVPNTINVDRRAMPAANTDHLPRLFLELNHKEWEEAPLEYRGMYWRDEGQSKWRLHTEFVEAWGR